MIEVLTAPTEPNIYFVVIYEYKRLICSGMYYNDKNCTLLQYNEIHDKYDKIDQIPAFKNPKSINQKYFISG